MNVDLDRFLARNRALEHDAVRILMIVHVFGVEEKKDGRCRGMNAEYHLHKIDFYLRNPDYLADAMLTKADARPKDRDALLSAVTEILNSREPDLRRIPMQRLFHGAYEDLGELEQYLTSRGLLLRRPVRRADASSQQHTVRTRYYLTDAGCAKVDELLAYPEARWYHERCAQIAKFLGRNPADFRTQQYAIPEYASAALRSLIPSIADRVRIRAREEFKLAV